MSNNNLTSQMGVVSCGTAGVVVDIMTEDSYPLSHIH